MYELPNYVTVDNMHHPIRENADYRVILDVISACEDPELSIEEQTISALIVFYEEINSIEDIFGLFANPQNAVEEMMRFISVNDDEIGYRTAHKVIDWIQDEKLIVSAVNNVAHTEIRALPYLHWWTFIGHYMAIGECPLSNIVGIRDKIARGKKLEKYEQDFRRQNPQYFRWRKEEQEARLMLDTVWNKS